MSDARQPLAKQQERYALQRALLQAGREPEIVQHKLDAAELAVASNEHAIARALYALACVRMGFAPEQRAKQAATAREIGLPPLAEGPQDARGVAGFSVHVAVAELRSLVGGVAFTPGLSAGGEQSVEEAVRAIEPTLTDFVGNSEQRSGRGKPDIPAAVLQLRQFMLASHKRPFQAVAPSVARAGAACIRLHESLARDHDDAAASALAALLEKLKAEFADLAPLNLYADVAGVEQVAASCLANDLRHFLLTTYALWHAPVGSAALLHAAARLNPSGLGSYFSNVPRILRTSRDLLGMLQLASEARPDPELLTRWLPPLAAHLEGHVREDLVDQLGDVGVTQPLWAILAVAVGQSPLRQDRGLVWRVRDAALDLGVLPLAIAAQRTVAAWDVVNAAEWRILAEIHATAGAFAEAERAMRVAWSLALDDPAYPARMEALAAKDATEFIVPGGFGSSLMRRRRRMPYRSTGIASGSGMAA